MTSQPYQGLPQNQPIDKERARELYKYFRPPVASEPLDTVLTAHAQLVAWRLNAERAMISLIDEETQYFVAESTKTVHLNDAAQYDNPEDAIWAGVGAASPLSRSWVISPVSADIVYSASVFPKQVDCVSIQFPRHRHQKADRRVLKCLI